MSAAADARGRLPREPYPGLRPFLDFEAALLFGRERQVREVIEHLGRTQFVAVLGGSGSGKSSLIHAGVMPELRSFGIPGAGDLWLPLTCTPGTNVSSEDHQARRHSPIARLARRFAGLLKSCGSEAADAQRITEIAEVFRQEAGFARLLDTYGSELAVPPGPDPADARVLFVVDQFEEIFHPTNKLVADASLLVERVLDHFFNPHPRCYVVLTMRSEHLNDCATFLELPDAINKSSYLIRRLDTEELRGAITGPAQRFLRLVARSGDQQRPLPEQVVFEDAVLKRLLDDVQAIAHDPDHLPLLQHLLARLWEAALEREEMDVLVPSRITEIDLARAVNAMAGGDDKPLSPGLNTLRACVENWPETLYRWHDQAKREQFDNLFRHLAFKDPNTGLYSQQRIDVDAGALLLGPGMSRADLRALIAEGFLGSVDYLFWDDEDPTRVTLKVSHESFIRGWARFRNLIDEESAHFEEFLGVLRKCADWSRGQRGEDYLLEAGELRRLGDSGFLRRLRAAGQRSTWRRFLGLDRDAERLTRHEAELDAFFAISQDRVSERVRREARLHLSRKVVVLATVLFALVPTTLFTFLVLGPTMQRAELLLDASDRANGALLSPTLSKVGAASAELDALLKVAGQLESARQGGASLRMDISRWLLERLESVGDVVGLAFKQQRELIERLSTLAEPSVNGTLHELMTNSIWRASVKPPPASAVALAMPEVEEGARCTTGASAAAQDEVIGRLFVSARQDEEQPRTRRALFVPLRPDSDRKLDVFSASLDPATGQCTVGEVVLSSPAALDSRVVFDASLRYFYYTVQGASTSQPTVIVQQLDWERGSDGRVRALQRQTLTSITDPQAVALVHAAAGPARAAAVPAWRVMAGRQVEVAGRGWRIVSKQAQLVEMAADSPALRALSVPAADSACANLARSFKPVPAFREETLESEGHCFRLARGWPAENGEPQAALRARDEVRVWVYQRPSQPLGERTTEQLPAPLAMMQPFARVTTTGVAAERGRWFVVAQGAHEGWLLMRGQDQAGSAHFIGAPWSTCALWRLGRDLQAQNPAPDSRESGLSSACLSNP